MYKRKESAAIQRIHIYQFSIEVNNFLLSLIFFKFNEQLDH